MLSVRNVYSFSNVSVINQHTFSLWDSHYYSLVFMTSWLIGVHLHHIPVKMQFVRKNYFLCFRHSRAYLHALFKSDTAAMHHITIHNIAYQVSIGM